MAKYGRYYESKKKEEEAHKTFLIIILTPFAIGILGGLINFVNGTSLDNSSSINCHQAQIQWKAALDARDAITPTEAVTPDGRVRWERLRDRANELEIIVDGRCN